MERPPGSPIEAEWVARQKTACDELSAVNGELWFIQSDPDLAGLSRLMRCNPGEKPTAVTPEGVEVGSWLHAYGGGAYAVTDAGVWFVNGDDSCIYLLDPATREYRRMAPLGDGYVYGNLCASSRGILAVRESATAGDQIIELTDEGSIRVLVESPGFLASPTTLDGRLAYLAWDADKMPWDSSRLHLTSYDSPFDAAAELTPAGGLDESITEPRWGPDGALYFLSDRTGWWNLYRRTTDGVHHVLSVDQDCCPAPWEAGYRSYAFLPGGSIIVTLHDGFRVRLAIVDNGRLTNIETSMTSVKPYLAVADSQLAVIGSNTSLAPAVRFVALGTRVANADVHDVGNIGPGGKASAAAVGTTGVAEGAVQFLLRHGPGADSGGAPLLVRAHPGPTDKVPLRLDWTAEYFVSRGFAVADVAYRGSSGFGRSYRRALYGHWGEYDVEDCEAVARHLLAIGIARPGAVFISGASAGGYTALQAARVSGVFTAAAATSAITDPERWANTAPRFQRSYAAALAGPKAAVRAKDICIPVLLIHGTNDPVAPADDARQLANELSELGKEHQALFLDGGGHYLSDPRSRRAALQAEADFYAGFIESNAAGNTATHETA